MINAESDKNASAVRLNNIGKRFKLYRSKVARIKQILNGRNKQYFKEFVALKDISIDVRKGSALTIIGKMEAEKHAFTNNMRNSESFRRKC